MRGLLKLFERRYSAVNVSENPNPTTEENLLHLQNIGFNHRHRKSLQATKPLKQGLSIVDSFFNQRSRGGKRVPKCAFLLLAAGLCAIGSAIAMYIIQPYDAIFRWKLIFAEGGEIFNLWQKPPVNLYIKIYLWNITNSEQFLSGKEKMRVEEVGPYVYREVLTHDKIVFNDNGTLSTVPTHPLVWDEELSKGHDENDMFIVPNIALLSIAQVASEKSYFFRLPINLVIRQTNSQPIVKMSAKEFMFGYKSSLTTLGNQFLPDWIYFDKVGLIDRMYDFDGDHETFYTGETDNSISGLYDTFMGSKNLKQWNTDHCNYIGGASDGTKFKSFIQPEDDLLFFRKSMCRPQRLIRVGNETVKSNLQAYKYQFENNSMDNGLVDERNKCFCRDGNCLQNGLLDISECYYGFPIALSYPHFLDTDEKVAAQVEGLSPNRSKHETYFYVQPMSGLPLELSVKFQINMAMRDVSNMAHVDHFSNIVIPMLWFEITLLELPESLKNRFNLYLNVLPLFTEISQWALLVGGVISLLFAITRVSVQLSNSLQSSHKISKQRKYSSIYPDTIQRLGDTPKVYEMDEKSRRNSSTIVDNLYDIDLNSEKTFMLDEEPAISEDESSESDSKSGDETKRSETHSLRTISTDVTLVIDGWQMGPTSSCINDIGNDDFPQILHIEEASDDDEDGKSDSGTLDATPIIQLNSHTLFAPIMRTCASDNSISQILEKSNGNLNYQFTENEYVSLPSTTNELMPPATEMKSAGSDFSISFILDRDNLSENYDENTFANVNTNALGVPGSSMKEALSDISISNILDRV